jgi:hypothetical protein
MATLNIPPDQAFGILVRRIETRIQALRGVKLDGYNMAISELDNVLRQLRKAQTYYQSQPAKPRGYRP